jgi:hypothetical protein
MFDCIHLGPAPSDEEPVQIGRDGLNAPEARQEARRFAEMLRKVFPDHAKHGCVIVAKSLPHDFGVYYEVAVKFDDKDAAACDYALFVEANTPLTWHDTAVREYRQAEESGTA